MHKLRNYSLILVALFASILTVGCTNESTFVAAHFTDIHLRSQKNASPRFRAAVAQMRKDHPDIAFVLNTGDVLDGKNGKWAYWTEAVKAEMSDLPIYSLFGNHDHEADIKDAKALCKLLKMPAHYYSFDHKGYRFVMLDGNTIGRDKKQVDWLAKQLKDTPKTTHVVILSHQPLSGNKTVTTLLKSYPNVKLCLAGHTHHYRRTVVNGIPHIQGGAVSGYWWHIEDSTDGKGGYKGTPQGYGLITFCADGTFDYKYIPHGK